MFFSSLEVFCVLRLILRAVSCLQKDRINDLKTEHMDIDHERSLLKESKEDVRRIDKKNDYMDGRDMKGDGIDSQKEQFLLGKKKLTLRDNDSPGISNQAREGGDKFRGDIATSSTYDDKG